MDYLSNEKRATHMGHPFRTSFTPLYITLLLTRCQVCIQRCLQHRS